ncbi:MAG: aminotransferase class III-fold pyridoxal phosphate-dependent enzyme [Phascolarctobacterium sp.]|nr:aminotransferase class III-fold pyridoxal phosphate-dependent enzyme [Phascolarctobacterium sp.]
MNYVEETISKYEKYINPAQAKLFRFMGLGSIEASAEGWTITDSEGRQFTDFLGGYGMFAVGHRNPKVVEAVERELHGMPMCGKVLFNRPMADLAEALAEITPGDLQYSFFVNSGTEAVEGCLKMARLATKRTKFVAAKDAFHGKTMGSLTATGRDLYRQPFQPLLNGFTHVPFGDAAALEAVVDEETAAVILEPIQGEGGIIVPPAGYLKQAKAICEAKGALLIADEVQTGIGRTGTWFGCNHDGVAPDLMACAKALGGGVMPIGAIIGSPKAWEGLIEAPFLHTSTFGGNQLACAAGVATIQYIKEENLLVRSSEVGAYLKAGLQKIAEEFPSVIKEVRGTGMMLGIELTKEGAGGMLMSLMIDKNVIVAYTLNNPKVIRMEPPLIVPKEVVDEVLAKFYDAVKMTADVIEDLD